MRVYSHGPAPRCPNQFCGSWKVTMLHTLADGLRFDVWHSSANRFVACISCRLCGQIGKLCSGFVLLQAFVNLLLLVDLLSPYNYSVQVSLWHSCNSHADNKIETCWNHIFSCRTLTWHGIRWQSYSDDMDFLTFLLCWLCMHMCRLLLSEVMLSDWLAFATPGADWFSSTGKTGQMFLGSSFCCPASQVKNTDILTTSCECFLAFAGLLCSPAVPCMSSPLGLLP